MDALLKQKYEARALIAKALAHPSRLRIIDALAKGRQCVNELTELIGADTSTVSKHLSVLKNAGIVKDEKQGLQVHYELIAPCVTGFFECMDSVIQTRTDKHVKIMKCCGLIRQKTEYRIQKNKMW